MSVVSTSATARQADMRAYRSAGQPKSKILSQGSLLKLILELLPHQQLVTWPGPLGDNKKGNKVNCDWSKNDFNEVSVRGEIFTVDREEMLLSYNRPQHFFPRQGHLNRKTITRKNGLYYSS